MFPSKKTLWTASTDIIWSPVGSIQPARISLDSSGKLFLAHLIRRLNWAFLITVCPVSISFHEKCTDYYTVGFIFIFQPTCAKSLLFKLKDIYIYCGIFSVNYWILSNYILSITLIKWFVYSSICTGWSGFPKFLWCNVYVHVDCW